MDAVISFACLSTLLLTGKILRVYVPLLQRLYLPSAVVGGLLGLLCLSIWSSDLPPALTYGWKGLPGVLINVVFATLFLGMPLPSMKTVWRTAAPQFCYGQMLGWGQYVVGLGIVLILLEPLFGVGELFGCLLEIGFQGGHGTVGGLSQTFNELGWGQGADLGFAMATLGMVAGVVCGMALVNVAIKRNWVKGVKVYNAQSVSERRGLRLRHEQQSAGKQTVWADSIDSLAFHIAVVGLTVLIGYGFKQGFLLLDRISPSFIQNLRIFQSFPLFPLCMLGGLLVQSLARRLKVDYLIDRRQMQHLGGAALDFLVVSAIASIQLNMVVTYIWPLLILFVVGVVWNTVCLLFLAPRMLSKEAWFEQGIAEFGQASGVTATGLLLLRSVDPQCKTIAHQAFGYKQLLHEPIMGGGVWTSIAVMLVAMHGGRVVWWFSLVMLILVFVFYIFVVKRSQGADN